MSLSLFPSPSHDPGGRVRLPLPATMQGGATFCGPADCYRTLLWRSWGPPDAPHALFVGMNPSTADAAVDDPTCRREIGFVQRWGFTRYLKCNVSAYRATDPLRLRDAPIRCAENLDAIRDAALGAERVVLAFGALKGPMRDLAAEVVAMLMAEGVPLWCLGKTADFSPRHPLYLRSDAELVRWTGWR